MAKQAPFLNSWWLIGGLLLAGFGCQKRTPSLTVPARFVTSSQPGWQRRDGRLWLADTLFNGWRYVLHATGDTAFVGAYHEGREEGLHCQWYANGQRKEARNYQNGWQEGEQRGWYETGNQAFSYTFRQDVYQGLVREWYANGRLAREGHYHEGHEVGLQRVWFADGSVKANYEARNGRNYGFTGVKRCVNVRDSIAILY